MKRLLVIISLLFAFGPMAWAQSTTPTIYLENGNNGSRTFDENTTQVTVSAYSDESFYAQIVLNFPEGCYLRTTCGTISNCFVYLIHNELYDEHYSYYDPYWICANQVTVEISGVPTSGNAVEASITFAVTNLFKITTEAQLNEYLAIPVVPTDLEKQLRLIGDIELTNYVSIENGMNVELDLNGHSLSRNLSASNANGSVISIKSGGTFTLKDSSGNNSGLLTGGRATNGGGVLNKGTFHFNGGTITGCNATNGGAVRNDGTMTMNGGVITSCNANDCGGIYNASGQSLTITSGSISYCQSNAGGGGVVNYGTASISNCTMSFNTATTRGGAIWSNGPLTVDGCTIAGNEALAEGGDNQNEGDGGAIHINGGTTTLTDVTINDNQSKDAGAIYVKSGATLNINGTNTISDNTSLEHGGGGIVNEGTVNLSGSVTITGNTCHTNGAGIWSNGTLTMQGNIQVKDNIGDDIYLKGGKIINVNGALTCGANSIGINMETPSFFTSGYGASGTETNPFYPSGTSNGIGFDNGEARMLYTYYECSWDEENQEVVYTKCFVPENVTVYNICTSMYASGGDLTDSQWFVADGTGSTANGLTCGSGDRHIILCDGASITINNGLFVPQGSTLYIYSQSFGDNMGKLTSNTTTWSWPGIGGKDSYTGTIVIHGGDITATGGRQAAGIGGREDKPSGTITIYNGKVTAQGGASGAGIGGGEGGSGEDITIYNGTVTATGGDYGAGIGGGAKYNGGGNGGNITIFGGSVNATGGVSAAGIGGGIFGNSGAISIHGGIITATGGNKTAESAYGGAGIGGGGSSGGSSVVVSINITGGIVEARGNHGGAGIGSGSSSNQEGPITISGGEIRAYGGNAEYESDGNDSSGAPMEAVGGGAGIGTGGRRVAGSSPAVGTIVLSGGRVFAQGGKSYHRTWLNYEVGAGAGIGGGGRCWSDDNSSITISGAEVDARGGFDEDEEVRQGAGIGGGYYCNGSNVIITSGQVMAIGFTAIGGGEGYDDRNGTLDLPPDYSVMAGSNMMAAQLQLAADRVNGCRQSEARIEPCEHLNASGNDNGASLGITCAYCDITTVPYTFLSDGDWNVSTNWLCGVIPEGDGKNTLVKARVTIPHNCTAHVGHIDMQDGGSITIADGGQLKHSNAVPGTIQKSIVGYGDTDNEGGWYLLGAPILIDSALAVNSGMLDFANNAIDFTTHGIDLYDFDQNEDLEWENMRTGNRIHLMGLMFDQAYLYARANNATLNFSTYENRLFASTSEEQLITVTRNTNEAEFAGWNLIPNPFTCNAYLASGRDFWRMNATGDAIVLATDENGGNVIKPCEGIFVVVAAENDPDPFILWGETVPDCAQIRFTTTEPASSGSKGLLDITVKHNDRVADVARVRFGEGDRTNKLVFNETATRLSIMQDGKDYSVVHNKAQGEMPVSFKAKENGTYTISVNLEDVEVNYLHLIDNMTGNEVDMLATPSYTFEAKTTDYASRFKLVFSANDASTGTGIFAYISDGNIIVNGEGTLQMIDMTGRVIVQGDAINRVCTSGMTSGVYVLRLINGNAVKTQKIVIK